MITICPTINTKCATIRCNTKVSHLIITFALPMCWAKLTMDTTHSFVLTSGDPKRDLIDPDVIDPNVLGQLDIVWEFLLLSFLWLLYRTTPIGLYFPNYHLMTVSMLTEGLLMPMTALRMLDTWLHRLRSYYYCWRPCMTYYCRRPCMTTPEMMLLVIVSFMW